MTLTLEVSPETAQRVERAKARGINIETLLCHALEPFMPAHEMPGSLPQSFSALAGKYEGEAWEELLVEIERNRQPVEQSQSEE